MKKSQSYIPAAKFEFLTDFFDPFMKYAMKENEFKNKLLDEARIQDSDKVLDFGCGTATLTLMAKKKVMNSDIYGLDIDPKVLEIAKRKIASEGLFINLEEFDGSELPYNDEKFDKIISSLVFHHLVNAQKKKMLKELYRVTKIGGGIYIADFGRPHNISMKFGSYILRAFDGYSNTKDNLHGLMPMLMEQGGYKRVEEVQKITTILGTVSIYKGIKL